MAGTGDERSRHDNRSGRRSDDGQLTLHLRTIRHYGWILVACVAPLLLTVGCEAEPPVPPVTRPATSVPAPPDVGRILNEHGVPWFSSADGRWVTFPQQDDDAWLSALARLRQVGFLVEAREGEIVVRRDGHEVARIVPPDRGWLVLIIDDLGFRTDRARRIIELGQPVFMAVLPARPESVTIARMAAAAGLPVLLHQPMEPRGYPGANPGGRAMLKGQSVETWRRMLVANLDALPGVVGLNNHMGSELSRDAAAAQLLAETARERDLLLIDSLTVPDSRIFSACRSVQARCLRRDVFLDNVRTPAAVARQARKWFDRAETHGMSVAIGHPHEVTIDVLGNLMAEIARRRLRLVGLERVNAWLTRTGAQ